MGEVQRPNDRKFCFVCDPGTYSLVPGSENDGNDFRENTKPDPLASCKPCKEGASCEDRGLIIAKNGWWRPDTNDSFYKCKTPTACLGAFNDKLADDVLVNLTGHRTSDATIKMNEHSFNESCAPGYEGRLCHRCIAGWSRDGPDVCKVCIAHGASAKWLALGGVALVFLVFGLFIWNSMGTKLEDPTSASITMKIAASHMQIIAIASGLPFKWPAATQTMFRAFDAISSVSEDVINLECVFADESDRSDDNSVVYQTTILILCGPFLFLFVASVFWSLVHCCDVRSFHKRERKKARESQQDVTRATAASSATPPSWQKTRQQIIVSVIVVMVLIHPTLTRRSVQLLTCDRLGEDDPNLYLRRDLQIVCWQDSHMAWAMTVGLPFLILYAIGIPLASLYVMFKRKHKLHTDKATVSKFGFLYLGYSVKTYYWEAIVMLRKVSMVMIDVVLGPSGVGVQALVSQLMMVLMFIATLQYQPFEAPHIGRLELFSLGTSFMTLWMGSFFWASSNAPFAMVVSVLIVVINIVFVVFLLVTLVGDACRDYEVVKTVKDIGRKTYLRASSLTSRTLASSSASSVTTAADGNPQERKKERTGKKQKKTPNEGRNGSRTRGTTRANSFPNNQIEWPEGEVKTFENPMTNNTRVRSTDGGSGKNQTSKQVELVSMSKPSASKPSSIAEIALRPAKPHRRTSTNMPPGWDKHETTDGRRYYENVVDQSTSWTPPKEATGGSTGRSAAAKPKRRASAIELPSGWIERVTDDGRSYYENIEDQSTSWTLPEQAKTRRNNAEGSEVEILVEPEGGGQHARNATFIPSGWKRHVNVDGAHYYQSPNGDTQWEQPPTKEMGNSISGGSE